MHRRNAVHAAVTSVRRNVPRCGYHRLFLTTRPWLPIPLRPLANSAAISRFHDLSPWPDGSHVRLRSRLARTSLSSRIRPVLQVYPWPSVVHCSRDPPWPPFPCGRPWPESAAVAASVTTACHPGGRPRLSTSAVAVLANFPDAAGSHFLPDCAAGLVAPVSGRCLKLRSAASGLGAPAERLASSIASVPLSRTLDCIRLRDESFTGSVLRSVHLLVHSGPALLPPFKRLALPGHAGRPVPCGRGYRSPARHVPDPCRHHFHPVHDPRGQYCFFSVPLRRRPTFWTDTFCSSVLGVVQMLFLFCLFGYNFFRSIAANVSVLAYICLLPRRCESITIRRLASPNQALTPLLQIHGPYHSTSAFARNIYQAFPRERIYFRFLPYTTTSFMQSYFFCLHLHVFVISFCKTFIQYCQGCAEFLSHCMPQGIFIFVKIDRDFDKIHTYSGISSLYFQKHLLPQSQDMLLPVFTSFSVHELSAGSLSCFRGKPDQGQVPYLCLNRLHLLFQCTHIPHTESPVLKERSSPLLFIALLQAFLIRANDMHPGHSSCRLHPVQIPPPRVFRYPDHFFFILHFSASYALTHRNLFTLRSMCILTHPQSSSWLLTSVFISS